MLHVAVVHLDIRLREEAENLRQQVPFLVVQLDGPVLEVLAQRHLFRHPVDLLLLLPEVVGPGIAERLVAARRGHKARQGGRDDGHGRASGARIERTG